MAFYTTVDERSGGTFFNSQAGYRDAPNTIYTQFNLAEGYYNAGYGALQYAYGVDADAYNLGILDRGRYTITALGWNWDYTNSWFGSTPTIRVYDSYSNLIGSSSSGSFTFDVNATSGYIVSLVGGYSSSEYLVYYTASALPNSPAILTGSIEGNLIPGETVSVVGNLVDFDGRTNSTLNYAWATSIDGTNWSIVGTNTTYVIQNADAGKFLDVAISFFDDAGNFESVSPAELYIPSYDFTSPYVISSTPVDAASNIAIASNIILTFSEAIQRGSGSIQIHSGSASGALIENFDATTSSRLLISGNTLTIDPTNNLANGTQYFVTLSYGAIKDLAGNSYGGTSGYDFTTVALVSSSISGTDLSERINGTSDNESIFGLAGSDTIFGGVGNDQINGGDGIDTAFYEENSKNFNVSIFPNGVTVTDKFGSEGIDTLSSIETIKWSDQAIDLSFFQKTASLNQAQVTQLVELYIASFNRAPDAFGLNYWGGQFSDGIMDLGQIAKSFFVQPETIAAYPSSQSTSYFVTKVYNNVLSRSPDQGGLNYWVEAIDSGRISKDIFLLAIINGAKAESGSADDKLTLINKTNVGMDYAFTEGLSNVGWASEVMSGVNSTSNSVLEAKTKADAYALAASSISTGELTVKIIGVWDVG